MTPGTCPTNQNLREYAVGNCSDDLYQKIEEHLSVCPTCEETIAQFDFVEDTLMRHLPLAVAGRGASPEPSPLWLDRLRKGVPQPTENEFPAGTMLPTGVPKQGLANYELLGVLGQGGMGIVYLARHRQLNRRVALKVLSPRLLAAPEAHHRFQREIELLGRLNHPGIVMATDAGTVASGAYLVMELIDGADLARVVRERGPLSVGEACEVGRQLADALAAAHESGAIHRDVKPSNVMIDRQQGRVRLLDFGLARLEMALVESGETSLGRLLGTLDYMAPEQSDGDQSVDIRADLYGLGATLFFLLTGRPPHGSHAGRSLLEHLRTIATEPAQRVGSLRLDVPGALDEFIARLLHQQPDQRPASATDAARELSRWAGGDLTARAAEIPPRSSFPEEDSQRTAEAERSLAELLGLTLSSALRRERAVTSERKRSAQPPRHRWLWVTLLGASAAALFFGVTVLLDTPQGTLRIEKEPGVSAGAQAPSTAAKAPERLYQGKPESEWQQKFDTETEPTAKLEAADALMSIAAELPNGQDIDRILDIGQDIAQASFGNDTINFAFEDPTNPPIHALRWPFNRDFTVNPRLNRQTPGNMSKAYQKFQDALNDRIEQLSGDQLAERLCEAIVNRPDPRAAFAYSLLKYAAKNPIREHPAAVRIVFDRLNVPLTGLDRSALCLLARFQFVNQAPAKDRQSMFIALDELAVRLQNSPPGQLTDGLNRGLVAAVKASFDLRETSKLPPGLVRSLARMLLRDVVEGRDDAMNCFPVDANWTGALVPFDRRYIADLRHGMWYFLDAWVSVANQYLEQHVRGPYAAPDRNVVESLEVVLRAYSDGDEWPVEKTAEILAEQLRVTYREPSDQAIHDLLPASAAILLTQIVRVTARVPDFIRSGQPQASSVTRRLSQLERLLAGKVEIGPNKMYWQFDELKDLLDDAPYETIRLSVGENRLPKNTQIILRGLAVTLDPIELLYVTSGSTDDANNRRTSPTDPLLLLVVLADLTGVSESQDERIATFFADSPGNRVVLRGHLENVLSSQLKIREVVARHLHEMAVKSKSQKLIDAIRTIGPASTSANQDSVR